MVKNDEFYTQCIDIYKEIEAYLEYCPDVFRGKTVCCYCDDPFESNFFRRNKEPKYRKQTCSDIGIFTCLEEGIAREYGYI